MKANLKGLSGIKGLFLAHGEKLGVLVVGVCAALLVYYSLFREKLPDNRAADLEKEISLARSEVDSFDWNKAVEQFPGDIRIAKPLEQKADNMVDVKYYQSDTPQIPWDRPVVPPTVLRTDPVLLAVQDVEATGGSGRLAFVNEAVRRQIMLEEQRKAAQQQSKQEKQMAKEQKAQEEGGTRRRGGRGGRGGEEDRYGGAGVFDPEYPNRRAVVGMTRPTGFSPQGYEEIKVAYWAVVVAKVPIKEQVKLYRDAFLNARGYDPTADIPQYLGYFVQRAEIRPGDEDKDPKDLTWEKVQVYNGKGQPIGPRGVVSDETLFGKPEDLTTDTKAKAGVVTDWAAEMPEVVDQGYLGDGVLAFPLPPLVGRDWGSEVTHSEIPLAVDTMGEVEEEAKPDAEKTDAPEEAEDGDLFAGGAAPGTAMGRRQPTYGGGRGGYGEMMEGGMRGGRGGGGEYGGGYGEMMRGGYGAMGRGGYGEEGYGGGGYGGRGYAAAGRGGLGQSGAPQAPHWLLRFFDFGVQPGKKYKYQVRLAVLDPNQYVGTEALDSAAISRIKKERATRKPGSTLFVTTDWGKPSRTVSIPLAGSVRVASAKPASDRVYDEPSTKLLVESFGDYNRKPIQAAKEEDFKRGDVANMTDKVEVLGSGGGFGGGQPYIDEIPKFEFRTGITVVDIRGGERLVRDDKRPARVLLMDPAGQLFVQNELDDLEAVEMHRTTFAKEPPGQEGRGYDMFRGGEGPYGGRGGYGGFEGGARGGR